MQALVLELGVRRGRRDRMGPVLPRSATHCALMITAPSRSDVAHDGRLDDPQNHHLRAGRPALCNQGFKSPIPPGFKSPRPFPGLSGAARWSTLSINSLTAVAATEPLDHRALFRLSASPIWQPFVGSVAREDARRQRAATPRRAGAAHAYPRTPNHAVGKA